MPLELTNIVGDDSEDIGFKAAMVENLQVEIHNAGVQATQEVFEQQILPAAKAGSPVGGHLDPHPGQNRDSIQVSFKDHVETGWISAWLFTESGYGWLIEHGTSHDRRLTKMAKSKRHGQKPVNDRTPARPYLYPAVMQFVANIAERAREILEGS